MLAKDGYLDKQAAILDSPSPSIKNWWKLLKNLSGIPSTNSVYPPLNIDENIIENHVDKANCFNIYFCKQSSIDDSGRNLPPERDNVIDYPKLCNIYISQRDVEDVLLHLNISKASGPDLMHPRLLKIASTILKYPLSKLFNKSLQSSYFPHMWKFANITPVFKNKGEKDCISNYRPISLLSSIGKIMARCIFKYVHNFLLKNILITNFNWDLDLVTQL